MKLMLALALAAAGSAYAAGSDDLWEVTTQMNMAGMPAGMGAQTQQVCSEKSAERKPVMPKNERCKLVDYKESGNKVTIRMSCPEGDGVIEQTFNATRTEYKGTMKMSGKQGDMTMAMNGRKVGTCDARVAKAEREEKQAAVKQHIAGVQAQTAAMYAQQASAMVTECKAGADAMDARKFGQADCAAPERAQYCQAMQQQSPDYKKALDQCSQSKAEYCKRYPTMDGFLKAKGDEVGAKLCNVSSEKVKGAQCPVAQKNENLDFLLQFCTVEARTVAKAHCAGREYTSRIKDKYTSYCLSYYSKHMEEAPPQDGSARPVSASSDPKQAVQQGINKLKGLFGK